MNGVSHFCRLFLSRFWYSRAIWHRVTQDPRMVAASFAPVLTTVFIYSAENAELLPSSETVVIIFVACIVKSITENMASIKSDRLPIWLLGFPINSPVCFLFLVDFWRFSSSLESEVAIRGASVISTSTGDFRASSNVCRRIEVNCLSMRARAAVGCGRTCKR